MSANDGLLIPAAQKLYSALSNLEKFSKRNDFFDNVRFLDGFLSEYRNITFVTQKSLAHSDLITIYEKCRDKYLTGEIGKWFIKKRNEVIKEHPFQLTKVVIITIYDSASPSKLITKRFSAEDDKEYSDIIEDVHKFLKLLPIGEISFSIEYVYKEFESEENLFDKLFSGINMMLRFFIALNTEICDDSKVYCELWNKISALNIFRLNTTDLFVDDLVYYKSSNTIENGSRIELRMPNIKFPLSKMPGMDLSLQSYGVNIETDELHELFLKVLHLHIFMFIQQHHHIMPTIFIIYNDLQTTIQSFDSSIRATMYRKINNIAEKIMIEKDIIAVFIFHECWAYPNNPDILYKNYQERVASENPTSLFVGHMINNNLDCYSYHFEDSKIDSYEYIHEVMSTTKKLSNAPIFMTPIYNAFDCNKSSILE